MAHCDQDRGWSRRSRPLRAIMCRALYLQEQEAEDQECYSRGVWLRYGDPTV